MGTTTAAAAARATERVEHPREIKNAPPEQGRGGEEELGTELYSQEFPINKPAVKQIFTPHFT